MPGTSHPARLIPILTLLVTLQLKAAEPDWPEMEADALRTLIGLVRLDTSQPAGNETDAALYLKQRLSQSGIESTIYESAPHRGNLVARLRGNGSKAPLLLLGHLDVVTAERNAWSVDPFAGVVEDGRIYGRGTADDKGIVAAELVVMTQMHEMGVALDRDLIFLAVADEERGGDLGISYMLEHHSDAIMAEFALNEGGRGEVDPLTGRYTSFNIGTGEKIPRRVWLRVSGQPGHGSIPTTDNAIAILAQAVARIFTHPLPVRLNETTRTFFERLAAATPPEEAAVYRAILEPNPSIEAQRQLQLIDPAYYSMIRTSVVPTMIQGGYEHNVIPSKAEALLDIRVLPDEDADALFETIRTLSDTPGLQITPLRVTRPPHLPSPTDTPLYLALESVLGQRHPDALVLPTMNTGASDAAQLRAAGIPTYGFGPGVFKGEQTGVHGNDEHLDSSAYYEYLRILWNVVHRVAASTPLQASPGDESTPARPAAIAPRITR